MAEVVVAVVGLVISAVSAKKSHDAQKKARKAQKRANKAQANRADLENARARRQQIVQARKYYENANSLSQSIADRSAWQERLLRVRAKLLFFEGKNLAQNEKGERIAAGDKQKHQALPTIRKRDSVQGTHL